MPRWYAMLAGGLLLSISMAAWSAEPSAEDVEFFEKNVRPVLVKRCVECHGADNEESELRVDSLAALLEGGTRGPALVPGNPKESLLVSAINHDDVLQMPPKKKLSTKEIADLTNWIKRGAPWPGVDPAVKSGEKKRAGSAITDDDRQFWSFKTPVAVEPPAVRDESWVQSPIDRFILRDLEAKNLRPAPRADKRTLIRRVTFDLTGLPPTPEEIEQFVRDTSPEAYAKLLDRLLQSPRYGERWGRHWLDVARYADSNGMDENLAFASAFRYRDYVIQAFNQDKPYDRFLVEQIAGDLLPAGHNESEAEAHARLIATGFLAIGPKMLADDDPKKKEMDIIDEQLDTLGKAILGMTLGCARCHDHKFDPIPTSDYYSLAGIFKSTKTMENFGVVANWHEYTLESQEQKQLRVVIDQKLKDLDQKLAERTLAAQETFLDAERARAGQYLLAASHYVRFTPAPDAAAEVKLADPKSLKPQLQVGQEAGRADVIVIEAERYTRGTARKNGTFIQNGGNETFLNEAEYDLTLPQAGNYQIEFLYASGGTRRWRFLINGELVKENAANQVTGGFGADQVKWFAEMVVPLPVGKVTLRVEQEGATPHLDKIALIPTQAAPTALLFGRKTFAKRPAELAKELNLQAELLDQWIAYLQKGARKPSPLWKPWIDLDSSKSAKDGKSLVDDLLEEGGRKPEVLAAEFQTQFERALQGWRKISPVTASPQSGTARKGAVLQLDDPQLEAYRGVLFDPAGPYRVPQKVERFFSESARQELAQLEKDRQQVNAERPPVMNAMGVREGKVQNVRVHYRGNHTTLGPEVPRQFLRVIAGEQQPSIDDTQSGRLQLAQWLTRPDHPLTSRVMVNRVWRWHFGQGLVRSVDNFGRLGERPTHPELLDWLAVDFVQQGWSLKSLHKRIMLSSTYQMSTQHEVRGAELDPENKLYWRRDRRRLEAEAVRDALLAMGGKLDLTMGGSLLPFKNRAYVTGTGSIVTSYNFSRRSVYLPILRSAVYDVLQAFDFADPSALEGNRATTTVTPQALFMMNSDLVAQNAGWFAERLLARTDLQDRERLQLAFVTALGREATAAEATRFVAFLEKLQVELQAEKASSSAETRQKAWRSACRVLLASNEFLYVE